MMRSRIRSGGSDIFKNRQANFLVMVGRLKPNVTPAQAQAAMSGLSRQIEEIYPKTQDDGVAVTPMAKVPGRTNMVLAFLSVLLAATGLILAIACANVAGMMLARAASRGREIAVRMAIGASRRRLWSQLVMEGLVLFFLAGIGGVFASVWATDLLTSFRRRLPVPVDFDLSIDWRVMTFSLVICLMAGIGTGLLPALHMTTRNLMPALREEAGATAYRRLKLRSALIVTQVALSFLLLVGGGLFVRTLQYAAKIDHGFDPSNVDVVEVNLFIGGYTEDTGPGFTQALLDRVRALPGVQAASAARDLPMDGGRFGFGPVTVPGHEPPPERRDYGFAADWNAVMPGYFTTMRIPLVRGRDFNESDRRGAAEVAIVNEAFVKRFWPGEDPIGKVIHNNSRQLQIVGVAREIKYESLTGEPPLFVYVPLSQRYRAEFQIVVRHAGASVVPAIRNVVREMNPNLPLVNVMALSDVVAFGLIPQRMAAWVAGTLGLVGLLLTAVGVYGLTAYSVGRRIREIGIRIALGAQPADVRRLVVREGVVLVTIGYLIGIVMAAAVTRLLTDYLVGVTSSDPVTFIGAPLLFALTTFVASYLPTRRATQVDPVIALRSE